MAFLFHIPARGLHVGRYPPQPVSVFWPAPTLSPTFLMAQAIFKPNPFPYSTPTFSILIHSSHTYLPMKMEQTKGSETLPYKIQMPGNNPEEAYTLRLLTLCITVNPCDSNISCLTSSFL